MLARYVAESSDSRTPRRCHRLVICWGGCRPTGHRVGSAGSLGYLFVPTLPPHLRPETTPATDPSAIVTGPNYRISMLTPRLVRLEWSPTGQFTDAATQVAVSYTHLTLPTIYSV